MRLYDELDLLRPVQADPDSGNRYYSMAQAPVARRIRLLRSIDMPLEEIRAVVETRDLAAERDLLGRHEQRLMGRIKEYQRHLALLHSLLSADRLSTYLARVGEAPAGAPVAIYHTYTEAGIDVEVGIPVSHPIPGEDDIQVDELPGGPVACTLYAGSNDDLPAVHDAVYSWTREHGHEVAGPPREVYLTGATYALDPAQRQTDVVWPIR